MGLVTSIDNGRPLSGLEARRSTRVHCAVPLLIAAKNKMGQPFEERTSVVSVNLHGCRYQSRHDYSIGMWITLHLHGSSGEAESPALRAQVRSVRAPRDPSELYQIGVELESPANIWGISAPPQDWQRTLSGNDSPTQSPTGVTSERDPTAAATARPPAQQVPSEQAIAALQKAVRSAIAKQLDESLKDAICIFNEVSRARMRQAEESFEQRVGTLVSTAREEIVGRLEAQLSENQNRWEEQHETYRSRAEEIAHYLEKLGIDTRRDLAETQAFVEKAARELEPQMRDQIAASVGRASQECEAATARITGHQLTQLTEAAQVVTREASQQLEARTAEARSLMESAANGLLGELQRQADAQLNTVSEASQRIISSVAALGAENRAVCEARLRTLEDDLCRAADRSIEQFRNGLNSLLSSVVDAAGSGVERAESAPHDPEPSTQSNAVKAGIRNARAKGNA
jgi:hypothetical protein